MNQAQIFDIARASFVDGPGIRTTVFFYGCNLRCQWCHNPEGIGFENVAVPENYKPTTWEIEDLLKLVCEDKSFYKDNGGVTCSGGECLLQSDFLAKFLKLCKENGIHTCVDTAGNVPFENFEKIIPFTDIFLYDVKCITSNLHKKFTGVPNQLILNNLRKLSERGAKIIVRVPLIPEFNGNEQEFKKIKSFLNSIKILSIEVLPYHTLGVGKYKKLNLSYEKFSEPSEEDILRYKKILNAK